MPNGSARNSERQGCRATYPLQTVCDERPHVLICGKKQAGKSTLIDRIITAGGSEIQVAWEDINAQDFAGELVNGKGETSQHDFTGAELSSIMSENGVEVTADAAITVTSEDNYSAELTGAEVLEAGKVYVALTDGGEMIEGIDGGQGAQLIVFGDPNSKRAVRYMKTVTVD